MYWEVYGDFVGEVIVGLDCVNDGCYCLVFIGYGDG